MKLQDIHVPPEWARASERVVGTSGPAVVLGAVDTGKSALVQHLLGRSVQARGPTALLDGDLGTSTVGIPGMVGLTLVLDVDALEQRAAPDRSWFVGSTTPEGAVAPVLVGHARFASVARAERLPLVVSTSSFVFGGAAKELQLAIVEVTGAETVVGIQSDGEIEHLLRPLEARGISVLRVPPSARVRRKPRAERAHRRAERFQAYFAEARSVELSLADVVLEGALLGSGRPLADDLRKKVEGALDTLIVEAEEAGEAVALVVASPPHEETGALAVEALGGRTVHVLEAARTVGLLVGLLSGDGECLGCALLEAFKGEGLLQVLSPLGEADLERVRRVRLGGLRVARSGEELGFSPGERVIGAPVETVDPEASTAGK